MGPNTFQFFPKSFARVSINILTEIVSLKNCFNINIRYHTIISNRSFIYNYCHDNVYGIKLAFGTNIYIIIMLKYTSWFCLLVFTSLNPLFIFYLRGTGGATRRTTKRGRRGSKIQNYKENENHAHTLNSGKETHEKPQYSRNCGGSYLGKHTIRVSMQEHHSVMNFLSPLIDCAQDTVVYKFLTYQSDQRIGVELFAGGE